LFRGARFVFIFVEAELLMTCFIAVKHVQPQIRLEVTRKNDGPFVEQKAATLVKA
jgi:hypothetical protein